MTTSVADAWRVLPNAPATLPGNEVRFGVDHRGRLSLSRFAAYPRSTVLHEIATPIDVREAA